MPRHYFPPPSLRCMTSLSLSSPPPPPVRMYFSAFDGRLELQEITIRCKFQCVLPPPSSLQEHHTSLVTDPDSRDHSFKAMARPRCYPNDGTLLPFDSTSEIPRHLSLLVTKYPPSTWTTEAVRADAEKLEFSGFFSGPLSVALGLFLLSLSPSPFASDPVHGKSLIEWAKEYLEAADSIAKADPSLVEKVSCENCGVLNHHVNHSALAAILYQDEKYVKDLVGYVPVVVDDSSSDNGPQDEWIYGRSGFLYALRMIPSYFPSAAHLIPPEAVQDVISAILRRNPDTPTPWRFVNRLYLSIGHGWLGPLAQIALSDPTASRARQVRPWIMRIISEQLPNGNWNKFMDEPESESYQMEELIQVGHGAPGVVVGLLAVRPIYERFDDVEMVSKIDRAVDKSQEATWTRGLITKESSLIHGASGNSLALLDLERKATFLAKGTDEVTQAGLKDGSLDPSSSPSGLHRGLIGTIWAMAEYGRGRSGVMPTFNDA